MYFVVVCGSVCICICICNSNSIGISISMSTNTSMRECLYGTTVDVGVSMWMRMRM
jgi:hypothetical protein